MKDSNDNRFATLGGGCFWCIEAVFETMEGIQDAVSGYAGGTTEKPNYESVCTGTTGHAEVVRLEYDPAVTSYQKILDLFFESHNPTTPNRQGADIGSQYRSIILYETDEQRKIAEATIARLDESGVYMSPIVTELKALDMFFVAETYHQDFFRKNPDYGYCRIVITPKLKKLQHI
jgi:peptide-methionine (S)-S-oxide reductase